MKKLLTLLLILALAAPALALADLPDISGLSVEELIELRSKIQLQLFSERLIEGVEVLPGVYMVGEDIPAGTYRIEYHAIKDYTFVNFSAYRDSPFFSYSTILGYSKPYEIGKITLEEGVRIEIELGSLYFYGYTGLTW